MRFTRARKAFATWLALLALALNIGWPLIAKAAPADVSGLSDICTVGGSKAAGSSHLPSTQLAGKHCSVCSLSPERSPPPSVAPAFEAGDGAGLAWLPEYAVPAGSAPQFHLFSPRAPPRPA